MKLVIRFDGGRLDGREMAADSAHDGDAPAVTLFRLSDQGTIGKKFLFIPPEDVDAIQQLGWEEAIEAGYPTWPVAYIVTKCVRLADSITVFAKHVSITRERQHSRFFLR
jgi:hypothetical protein